jgi:HD-like signal output (HDOD) protein/CheY-like chemotaxis protein
MEAHEKKPTAPGSGTVPIGNAPRKRVLFVDDEPAILEALKGVLRPQRHQWEMVFALGGPAGISEVERSTFDVVVTDMRMPILDGAALLTRVKELQPHAVRLVLSGQTDGQTALKTVFTAHQFLAKPCDPEKLRSVVKRCCDLNELLAGEELRCVAGDVSVLPSAPTTYLAISKALADPSSSIADVARIVEREPTLCAKVLQVANSAFFGLPRTVSSVSQAATYLGTLALRDLALAMETMASLQQGTLALPAANYLAFQSNALAVGLLGRRWFKSDRRKADEAFVAGMLRDMGHLVLRAGRGSNSEAGDQHAALSAYLLGLWGIPHAVIEAVAFHERPARIEHEGLEVVDVVHLTDWTVSQLAPSPFQAPPALDLERFAALGVTPAKLDELHENARDVLAEAKELLAL